VEAVGIDTAGQRRYVNAAMGRRPMTFAPWPRTALPVGRATIVVEAVGIEPTSEELRSPVSPCAAG